VAGAVNEVRQRRRGFAGLLGQVVPDAKPHRAFSAGQGDEGLRLRFIEDATLQCE
jgi:hypothetical protein